MKKRSGNRTPREKKPDDEKSKLVQFRLHPDNVEEAWAMERITHYRKNGMSLRQLFVDALAAYEDLHLPVRTIDVAGSDVLEIKDLLQYIAEKLANGEWVQGETKKRKTMKHRNIDLPDAVRNTIDRYIGGGLTDDEDE